MDLASRRLARHAAMLTLLLAWAPLAEAADPDPVVLQPVSAGDPSLGQALGTVNAPLAFVDAQVDQALGPTEPLYWDLDASSTVSAGDVRLRAFLGHDAGSAVAVPDLDVGRAVVASSAWFGATGGTWFADLDASRSVTPGDLRLDAAVDAVKDDAAERGQPLAYPQGGQGPGSVSLVDSDGDRRRDAGEGLYLNLDPGVGPPVVSVGDLRIVPLSAKGSAAGDGDDVALDDGLDGYDTGGGADGGGGDGGVRGLDVVLLLLAAANLAGLAYVLRTRRAPPRNPFK